VKSFLPKRNALNEDMTLQITSMADIFIIILVFLLKSFSTGAVNLSPAAGMMLPQAQTTDLAVEALKVEVSETAVQVEGNPVSQLKNFRFAPEDLQAAGVSKSLIAAFDTARQRQLLIAKVNASVKVDSKILIVADQRAPYTTIKSVLASAALQGYTDFKLAVVKGD